jgi:hypothetical protein
MISPLLREDFGVRAAAIDALMSNKRALVA